MVSGSISPPYSGYFSPFPHGTGSLSVSQEYLALPDGAGGFRRDFSGPALLRIPLGPSSLRTRDYHPLWSPFPGCYASILGPTTWSYNPGPAVTGPVWANPRSLATTCGITVVFSSSGYLDVSVPRVRLLSDDMSSTYRVAPFGYLRITRYVPFPAAFRSLSRPSSPLRA
jgi:hypothetical protein